MPYLGYVISPNGVRPDPQRVQALGDYKRPTNRKELQKFLGFCQYDRMFAYGFADMVAPLTLLLKKEQPWYWGEHQENAFQNIKAEMVKNTLLHHPDPDWCDMSNQMPVIWE
ncbi:uncharacterized protein [Leptinotarsa decemlineata]|uniref:uncharacterized protein n=1 Tax=Leptinotarsa decemlineata TaxID=7539 RepID=UPI003D30BAB8